MTKEQVHLGQEAYVLINTGGEVVRTAVGSIDARGDYEFFNGCNSYRKHWFDFDQTVAEAVACTKAKEARLRAELRALARHRKHLQSENYRAEVMSAPYSVVDLSESEKRGRTRRLKSVEQPGQYLTPGSSVYAVVTPKTQVKRDREVYRPYLHFVLEIKVQSATLHLDGVVSYRFSTPFEVTEYFSELKQAMKLLEGLSEPIFVSHEEEEQKLGELGDVPF